MEREDSSEQSKRGPRYFLVFALGVIAGTVSTAVMYILESSYESGTAMYGDPSASYPLWMELAGPLGIIVIFLVTVSAIHRGYLPRRL